jgi:hypothetical protein
VTEIFFPQREALRLDSQNLTPRARRKAVYAGVNEKSHGVAARSLQELAGWELNATRVSELTLQAGQEMKAQQSARVAAYHQQQATCSLSAPREVSPEAPANLPQVGVVEMDGGRIRTRQENSPRGVTEPHWREFQAGCVVRLQSEESAVDPRPEVPALFLSRPKVQKLVSQLHRQRSGAAAAANEEDVEDTSLGELLAEANLAENKLESNSAAAKADSALEAADLATTTSTAAASGKNPQPPGPVRLQRTCVATLEGADACGRILAAEAAQRGLDQARRKGFLGDGQSSIWSVFKQYFERLGYLPILDFIHLLSYVYALAMAVGRHGDEGWCLHVKWIRLLWSGQGKEVLGEWREWGTKFEVPTDQALPDHDPRRAIQRGITYLENNLDRVDYPRYRRLGLPVTSTLMESLVKEFNARVKGTEKFWNDPEGAEAILTVRASLLSEDDRFADHFASRPGCRYRRRSTLPRAPATPAAAA